MTTLELRSSLLQELAFILEDEKLMRKAVASLRHIREAAMSKPAEEDDYVEPTKEEILASIKEGLQDLKDLREGKDVGHKFMDAREWLKTIK